MRFQFATRCVTHSGFRSFTTPTLKWCHNLWHYSSKIREEFSRRNGQRPCQLYDIFQGHIPLAPFHAADIIAMQPGPLSQFFLRVATLIAELA
jgi:hypothetical protein